MKNLYFIWGKLWFQNLTFLDVMDVELLNIYTKYSNTCRITFQYFGILLTACAIPYVLCHCELRILISHNYNIHIAHSGMYQFKIYEKYRISSNTAQVLN